MGDVSAEPSMEDILASIKRVIKEGEAQAPARRSAPRPLGGHDRDAVLELNDPLSRAQQLASQVGAASSYAPAAAPPQVAPERLVPEPPASAPAPAAAPTMLEREPEPAAPPPPSAAAAIDAAAVSARTVEATRGALGALSRLVVKPEGDSDGTLEGLVRDMLRPMLSEWLDQNLPRLVEQMVAREIAKITNGQG